MPTGNCGKEPRLTTEQPAEGINLQHKSTSTIPLEVMLTIPTLLTGGAEKFVTELAVRFDPLRFRVTVLVTRGQTDLAHQQLLEDAGIEVIVVAARSRFHSITETARVLIRRRPQVVHTNIGSLLHVALGLLLLPRSVTRIHTLHSMAGRAEPGRQLAISKKLIQLLHFTPISISRAVRDSFSAAYDIPLSEIPLIPNGVDTERFAPPDRNERHSSDETRFVAVGSLLPVKQHQDLIVAFSKMDQQLQSRSRLTIVGGGPLRAELEGLIKELGLEQRITLMGNQKDVAGILNEHDVFVSASRTEGFPLSLLEGLAAGLPVAVTAVDGVLDIVRDEVEGLLVPPQDIASMSRAMERFVQDEAFRATLARQARQRATVFAWERCVESYGAVYADAGHEN